jgi:hypothetical protein
VWNEEPDADTLLQARVDRGWRPTATSTVTGDRIMGHAACRFTPPTPGTSSEPG